MAICLQAKSKLDWDCYKKTQGLSEELAQGTKDGWEVYEGETLYMHSTNTLIAHGYMDTYTHLYFT